MYQAYSTVTGVTGDALNDSPVRVCMVARSLLCGMHTESKKCVSLATGMSWHVHIVLWLGQGREGERCTGHSLTQGRASTNFYIYM